MSFNFSKARAIVVLLIASLPGFACSVLEVDTLENDLKSTQNSSKERIIVTEKTNTLSDNAFSLQDRVSAKPPTTQKCVLIIHGLKRNAVSMRKLHKALENNGYLTIAIDYPSTEYKIEDLSQIIFPKAIRMCRNNGATLIHLVAHSMGGIIARYYLKYNNVPELGRFVMLAPPNQGSELINFYSRLPGFKRFLGPAAMQIGTNTENSFLQTLGPVTVDTAVITASKSSNWLMSMTLPGPDDGKVTAASTPVHGMCAQVVLPTSHRRIVKDDVSVNEILAYISTGMFRSVEAVYLDCEKSVY